MNSYCPLEIDYWGIGYFRDQVSVVRDQVNRKTIFIGYLSGQELVVRDQVNCKTI